MNEERVERTFRCKKDGRTVAKVVIRENARVLDVVGGRDGHISSLRGESDVSIEKWISAREMIEAQFSLDFYSRTLERLTSSNQEVQPSSQPIPTDLDRAIALAGAAPRTVTAPCPRCHAPVMLTVSWNAQTDSYTVLDS